MGSAQGVRLLSGPAGRGGLKQRIQRLEEDCVRALGRRRFEQVHSLLKNALDHKLGEAGTGNAESSERAVRERVQSLLAYDGKLSYWNKIDNLIFMQEAV